MAEEVLDDYASGSPGRRTYKSSPGAPHSQRPSRQRCNDDLATKSGAELEQATLVEVLCGY